MTSPEVSVVMPTRNRHGFAEQALTSALTQEDVAVEVIVVDDGPEDPRTFDAASDPRVRVYRRAERGGPGRARNDGIARATARWVAFLDDDDLWAPHRLRAQLEAMGDADFGYCAVVVIDAGRHALGTFAAPRPETLWRALRRSCVIPGPSSVMARTKLLLEVGGFREDLPPLEDWDLWIRLAAAGRAAASGELLVAYTAHDENAHVRNPRAAIRAFDALARTHGIDEAGPGIFAWLAREQRQAGTRRRAAEIHLRAAWRHRDPEQLGQALAALVARLPSDPTLHRPRRLGPAWLERYREEP